MCKKIIVLVYPFEKEDDREFKRVLNSFIEYFKTNHFIHSRPPNGTTPSVQVSVNSANSCNEMWLYEGWEKDKFCFLQFLIARKRKIPIRRVVKINDFYCVSDEKPIKRKVKEEHLEFLIKHINYFI